MSKIRLHQGNTKALVAVGVIVAVMLIAAVNVAVIVPGLFRAFSPVADTNGKNPVDTDSINRALDALGR